MAEDWNPTQEVLRPGTQSREAIEMRTIRSLTSGMTRQQIQNVQRDDAIGNIQIERYGEVEMQLNDISCVYNDRELCDRLISSINIATAHREDVDDWSATRRAFSIISNERHSAVTPEELARKWNIGLQTAKETVRVTTQKGIRTAMHPMTRRVRVDHLHLHRPRLRGTWYVDTLLSKVKSKLGNTCANVYTQGKFTRVVPMTSRKDAGKSLVDFTDDVGIPERLITDGATEFTGRHTEFVKEARRMRIMLHTTEQGRKNQNHAAEREIGFLAKRWKLRMAKKRVPKRLWDYGLVYESELLSRMARASDRRTGYEEVTGQTPDISEWLDFEFYDLVWWLDRPTKPNITDETRRLARWLGVSHRVGSDLSYWLITASGKIISKTSVEHVTRDDYLLADKKKEIEDFNSQLEESLNDANFMVEGEGEFESMYLSDIEEDVNSGVRREEDTTPSQEDYGDMHIDDRPEDDDQEAVDKYLTSNS